MEQILSNTDTTIVTGLWDLGRGQIAKTFKRSYDHYLEKFGELLRADVPMFIYIDPTDEEFIWKHRRKENTFLKLLTLEELKKWFEFTELTNSIRIKETWLQQASWLRESPQATLEHYNPVVMSKMFMLNDAAIKNPFNSKNCFWLDAGITNTVHWGYFTKDRVLNNLTEFLCHNKNFVFITYPYHGGTEVHGFERTALAKHCDTDYVEYVCRGGFFGGKVSAIHRINSLYYSYLSNTLSEGYMGTEESIFTVLMHKHSNIITQYTVEENGLIWPFFESLKNNDYVTSVVNRTQTSIDNTGLYVITFNSPNQFETLIKSMLQYDSDFINKPTKILLNNSTDETTTERYIEICNQYNFEHIKKDNLGICGGRQFIAEHAAQQNFDFYFFFEDDMFLYSKPGEVCKNGFNRFVRNLYVKSLTIVNDNKFDFLKMCFTEFYGDNSTQWSWYNVPQNKREEYWPEHPKLPKHGLDPNSPKTQFNCIKSYEGIPYATGHIYYCNWPQIVSKRGNEKMFLDTKWDFPFEQTWMSHLYQLTVCGQLNPGLLLLTPVEHNRFDHYLSGLRREN